MKLFDWLLRRKSNHSKRDKLSNTPQDFLQYLQKEDYSLTNSKDKLSNTPQDFLQLIDRARKSCPGQNLWTVLSNEMETIIGAGNELQFEVKSWLFHFDKSSIVISSKGVNEIKEPRVTSSKLISTPGPHGRAPLAGVRIGYDEASRIAIDNGGIITSGVGMMGGGSGFVMLNMRNVDGENAPMWLMPHRLGGLVIIGIRADTGKLTYISERDEGLWTQEMPRQIKELLRKLKK